MWSGEVACLPRRAALFWEALMGVRHKAIVGSAAAAALVIGLGMAPVPVLADDNSPLVDVVASTERLSASEAGAVPSNEGSLGGPEAAAASPQVDSSGLESDGANAGASEYPAVDTDKLASASAPGDSAKLDVDIKPDEAVDSLADVTYAIGSKKAPDKAIDLPGGSTSAGTRPQTWLSNGTDAQAWTLKTADDGLTTIYHAASGKVLDVESAKAFSGAKVQLWNDNGTQAQKWILTADGAFFKIASALDRSLVLDLRWGSTDNGTPLQLWSDNGSDAQRWSLKAATTRRQRADALAKDNETSIADGTYTLGSVLAAGKVADARSGLTDNGTPVQTYRGNGTDAQVWAVRHDDNGYVTIVHAASGKVLDVRNGVARAQAAIQLYESNGTWAQKWIAVPRGDGSFKLLSALDTSLAVDVKWGSKADCAELWLYEDNGSAAQGWRPAGATTMRMRLDELAEDNRALIADGTYAVRSDLLPSLVLDARAAGTGNCTVVQTYAVNETAAQQWTVVHDAKGYVTLQNVNSGKVLDVSAGNASNGAVLQLYQGNGTYAQKWIVVRSGDGFKLLSALREGLAVDIPAASTVSQTAMQLYADNGTAAQRWYFSPVKKVSCSMTAEFEGNNILPVNLHNGDRFFALPASATGDAATLSFGEDVYVGPNKLKVSGGSNVTLTDCLGKSFAGNNHVSFVLYDAAGKEISRVFVLRSSSDSVFLKSDDPSGHGRSWVESDPDHKIFATGKLYYLSSDGSVVYDGKLTQIKGRGNGTWTGTSKKSYQIKLDKKTDLAQTGVKDNKNKTWTLISDCFDQSYSRNIIAYTLAQQFGCSSAVDFRSVDLYYDGEYRGSYLLCEKVQINGGRVDIDDLEAGNEKVNGDMSQCNLVVGRNPYNGGEVKYAVGAKNPGDISGGYLIEHEFAEKRYQAESAYFSVWTGDEWQHFVCKSPEIWSYEEACYMSNLVQDLFDAFNNGGVVPSWRGSFRAGKRTDEILDVDSLAKAYWLNEIMKNRDGYVYSSGYLYKDADSRDGRIKFGPAWDFDLSSGNTFGNVWDSSLVETSGWWTRTTGLGYEWVKDLYVMSSINRLKGKVVSKARAYLNGGMFDQQMRDEEPSVQANKILWGGSAEDYQAVRGWLNARLDWIEHN